MSMREYARLCVGMRVYARAYARVSASIRERALWWENATAGGGFGERQVCASMHEYAWCRCARICPSMRRYARVCVDMFGYARVCASKREYAGMVCASTRKCINNVM